MPVPKARKDRQKEHKLFDLGVLSVKIIDEDKGIVEEIVAVMGNIDHGRDRITNGAFSKTIQEHLASLLVLDQHNTDSIMRSLGVPLGLRELAHGELPLELRQRFPDATSALLATTQYLLDTPEGNGAFKRIKSGAIKQRSIGFEALDTDFESVKARKTDTGYELDEKGGETIRIRNIRTIKLAEYSPVLWGMNEATQTVSAKDRAENDAEHERETAAEGSPASAAASPASNETTEPATQADTEKGQEKEMTPFGPVRRMGEILLGNMHSLCGMLVGDWLAGGLISVEEHSSMMSAFSEAMEQYDKSAPVAVMQREMPSNAMFYFARVGDQIMVMKNETPAEEKAGRMISADNAKRLRNSMDALSKARDELNSVLEASGWLEEASDAESETVDAKSSPSPVEVAAAVLSTTPDQTTGAGPDKPPTLSVDNLDYLRARQAQLKLMGRNN